MGDKPDGFMVGYASPKRDKRGFGRLVMGPVETGGIRCVIEELETGEAMGSFLVGPAELETLIYRLGSMTMFDFTEADAGSCVLGPQKPASGEG